MAFLKPDDGELREERPDFNSDFSTSFIYNPYKNQAIDIQRKRLPIFQYREHVMFLLERHQIIILIGETGSGKSTQIPQYLLDCGWACDGKQQIAITQPRRIAAINLATRVAEETGTKLGQKIGYSIRFDEKVTVGLTRVKYLTEGMLLREMLRDPLLKNYCVIMVDEVHERSVNTDILLALLKKIAKNRPELRIIISSATLDADELRNYFDLTKQKKRKIMPSEESNVELNHYQSGSAVILSVVGRNFPIEIFFSSDPVPDYIKSSVETVIKISKTEPSGDILVFLTGQEEVATASELLKDYSQSLDFHTKQDKLWILPMHGSLPNEDQLKVFQRPEKGYRKVVLATNVAEASVTITGIVYVIDCGFVKMRWYNPSTQTDALVVVPISKASAQQRAGRAGRTRSGKVYRLYTEDDFEKLANFTPPEVQRSNLSPAVLQLKALGIDDVIHFDFPNPPPARHLAAALELLFALNAVDGNGQLTEVYGLKMAEFPVEPLMAKLLLMSQEFKCSEEMATIVAVSQVQNIFYYPTRGQESIKARIARRKFETYEGDLITYLNVATAYSKNCNNPRWCSMHYLNKKALKRALTLRDQLLKLMKRLGISIISAKGDVESVLRCISASYFPNTAYLHSSGEYRTVLADTILYVHPHSVLYAEEKAPWIMYGEVLHTTQLFMRDLTVVEPTWLEELAPHYFQKITETS